jgi:hypothetical protein
MHRTKHQVFIVPNTDQVPVPFKMFISFPPIPPCSALKLVIFEAGIKIAFLHDVSAVLLLSTDFFSRSSTIITYMANMDIRVISVIQTYQRRLNSKSKVPTTMYAVRRCVSATVKICDIAY